jgi:membrane protease YdiL (CAAX protease family)
MVERLAQIVFLLLLVAGMPVMGWLTARDPEVRVLSRRALYVSAALSEWFFAALGVAAVRVAHLRASELGFRALSLRALGAWVLLLVALSTAGLGVVLALERWGWWPQESDLVYRLMPVSREEKAWALALVAPTAALAEEFLYRGYLLAMMLRGFHSTAWAWALSSVVFGMAHVYQRANGMVRAALLGALLAWPLVRTGSLYPSIVAHFLIDAVALAWLGPKLLKPRGVEPGGIT